MVVAGHAPSLRVSRRLEFCHKLRIWWHKLIVVIVHHTTMALRVILYDVDKGSDYIPLAFLKDGFMLQPLPRLV